MVNKLTITNDKIKRLPKIMKSQLIPTQSATAIALGISQQKLSLWLRNGNDYIDQYHETMSDATEIDFYPVIEEMDNVNKYLEGFL